MNRLTQILNEFDSIEKKGFEEQYIVSKLNPLFKDVNDIELIAEQMAFNFQEDFEKKEEGWGNYFGPNYVIDNGDGTFSESPSKRLITQEIYDYWLRRKDEVINPVLKARYIGLVLDFEKDFETNINRFELVKEYLATLLNIASDNYLRNIPSVFTKLKRALSLSIKFKLKENIPKIIQQYINIESKQDFNHPGHWGFCFNDLLLNKGITLENEVKNFIIAELEEKLDTLNDKTKNGKFNPWTAEQAGTMLLSYEKNKFKQEVILNKIESGYRNVFSESSNIQISGWLDHLTKLYRQFGFTDESNRLLKEVREIGEKAVEEYGTVSHKYEIKKSELEELQNHLSSELFEEQLVNLAHYFLINKEYSEKETIEISREHFTSFFGSSLTDEKGRTVAYIGPIQEDLEGHVVQHITRSMSFRIPYFQFITEKFIFDRELEKSKLVNFICNSDTIEESRKEIIKNCIDFYLSQNWISFIHLAIPQIEQACRYALEICGGVVLKQKENYYQLRTFGEVLRDETFKKIVSEDVAFYFQILFTDNRGWNLRNSVCHGIPNPNFFSRSVADRVLHALLVLGLLKKEKVYQ